MTSDNLVPSVVTLSNQQLSDLQLKSPVKIMQCGLFCLFEFEWWFQAYPERNETIRHFDLVICTPPQKDLFPVNQNFRNDTFIHNLQIFPLFDCQIVCVEKTDTPRFTSSG